MQNVRVLARWEVQEGDGSVSHQEGWWELSELMDAVQEQKQAEIDTAVADRYQKEWDKEHPSA